MDILMVSVLFDMGIEDWIRGGVTFISQNLPYNRKNKVTAAIAERASQRKLYLTVNVATKAACCVFNYFKDTMIIISFKAYIKIKSGALNRTPPLYAKCLQLLFYNNMENFIF